MRIPRRPLAGGILALFLLASWTRAGVAATFQQNGGVLVMSNANVQVQYGLTTGNAAFYWQNALKISAFYAGVSVSGNYVKGINFSNRTWTVVSSNEVAVTSHAAGLPVMIQYFTLDQTDSFLTRVDLTGASVSANYMGPVIVSATGGVDIGSYGDDRALFVPFDNDHFVSYNAESLNGSDTGNEVGAFYDNNTRNGLVVGSVTHDTWKTGVYWSGSGNKLNQLNVFGGVTSHWTWDVMPHGSIAGTTVSSPTVFVGFGSDWRREMENFANENALFAPKLAWTNGVPFGWNSWGVTNYQVNISYNAALAVSDSIRTNLQAHGFTNNGTVYVNLDSYWSNLSSSQMQNFAAHCHANGQKAGVYWGPFVYWGTLNQATNQLVEGSTYHYSDILLRDSNENGITNDGAYAIDPTHPGSQAMEDYFTAEFLSWGFDYIKLDFLSHGSLEGAHYNPAITTGIQAFNQGMQRILSDLNGKMFISESIAPLFPYQYGHSRRIACDAYESEIGNTSYTMNGVSYGWWLSGRLYQYNDPDMLVFDNGPNTNEIQSRLINGAVTGLYLNGSILTNAASISLAQTCLTNAAVNSVARAGQTFCPVDSAAGTAAANVFIRQDGSNWCAAFFNYTPAATNETLVLAHAGLPVGTYLATNLWDGTMSAISASLTVSLNAKQAKLFRLTLAPSPQILASRLAGATNVIFSGGNGIPAWTYYLLASTNITLPVSQWPVIATNAFDPNGNFTITNHPGAAASPWYYLLRLQ